MASVMGCGTTLCRTRFTMEAFWEGDTRHATTALQHLAMFMSDTAIGDCPPLQQSKEGRGLGDVWAGVGRGAWIHPTPTPTPTPALTTKQKLTTNRVQRQQDQPQGREGVPVLGRQNMQQRLTIHDQRQGVGASVRPHVGRDHRVSGDGEREPGGGCGREGKRREESSVQQQQRAAHETNSMNEGGCAYACGDAGTTKRQGDPLFQVLELISQRVLIGGRHTNQIHRVCQQLARKPEQSGRGGSG